MLEDARGCLSFLVRQDWRVIVQAADLAYIESLLDDLLERAKLQPAPLFKQLSSLGVGPLVTQQTGENISDYLSICELGTQFVRL
jgi:hypothetical protein